MRQHLSQTTLEGILEASDISSLDEHELVALFQDEIEPDHRPHKLIRVDPRNDDRVIYSTARSVRPQDYPENRADDPPSEPECFICQGKTTGVIDVAELSEGFTFINTNLYPAVYPYDTSGACGLHLLQWTSSYHDRDWHNINLEDATIVMSRLAALERKLHSVQLSREDENQDAFLSIIKNYGKLVGSSLSHGHQQIMMTNVQPSSVEANRKFLFSRGETFAEYMLREIPPELVVRDYGPAVLLVPDFMRRPYVMMLFVKDTRKAYLHELSGREIQAIAHGWHDAAFMYHDLMPRIDKDIAYNFLTHNGAGAGLYFEFLPYTQILGGVERMGFYICTELPEVAAQNLREVIKVDRVA